MNYYYYIAGFPDLQPDGTKNVPSLADLRSDLEEQLCDRDRALLHLIYAEYDNRNLLRYLRDKDTELDPLGILTADDWRELIDLMDHFELAGGGGTDFRPAFDYVTRLCEEKKFHNLRGLLYFTDGMGTYPARRPPYDAAFLFLGDRFDDAGVPPWAMKVVLDEEEFAGPEAAPAQGLAAALEEEQDLYRDLNNS